MSTAYVLVEQNNGRLDHVTAELITAARVLGEVTAVVVGEPGTGQGLAAELGALGAAVVVAAESPSVSERLGPA